MQSRTRSASKVFESLTAPTNLKRTYRNHIRQGTARGRDGVVPIGLDQEIDAISALVSRKARAGTYKFTSYRQLLISKGAQRFPRVISIPTARDRILLKSIALLIETVFPESKGKVAQQKVAKLQRELILQNFDGFVRLDIENFYPSISHEAVMKTVHTKIRKSEILVLIQDSIRTPTLGDNAPRSAILTSRGVPQGLPMSNLLAEIAMQDIDSKFASDSSIVYLRYVDDIIILCDFGDAKRIADSVTAACAAVSLKVHDPSKDGSKSRIGRISESFDYLGYVFSPTKISVRHESIKNLKSSIARIFTRYKYQVEANPGSVSEESKARTECLWKLNLVITGCIFNSQRRGWVHYFSQIDDISLLIGLDATVRNFARRFGLSEDFHPKTFARAYWKINKADTGDEPYIPNFDTFSGEQMRTALVEVFHVFDAEQLNDDRTRRLFYKEVKRLVDKLEKDISGSS